MNGSQNIQLGLDLYRWDPFEGRYKFKIWAYCIILRPSLKGLKPSRHDISPVLSYFYNSLLLNCLCNIRHKTDQ